MEFLEQINLLPYVLIRDTTSVARVSYFEQLEDHFEGFRKGQQKCNNHFIRRMLFDKDLALNL